MSTSIRPVQPGDVGAIYPHVREIEVRECAAMGHTALQALQRGLDLSAVAFTVDVAGSPAAVFGVTPISLLAGTGAPWMLGTDATLSVPRDVLRLGRLYLPRLEEVCPRLHNYVHRDNLSSRRWLAYLGFAEDPDLVHIGGEPMLRFSKGFRRV